jgi:hypothetical protein
MATRHFNALEMTLAGIHLLPLFWLTNYLSAGVVRLKMIELAHIFNKIPFSHDDYKFSLF